MITELIDRYPTGFLSEPELIPWSGWGVAIRGIDKDGLDSPLVIVKGSYAEIRSFELAYMRAKETSRCPTFKMAMGDMVAVEVMP